MSDTGNVNGSVNNAALLTEIGHVRTEVREVRREIREAVRDKNHEFEKTCKAYRAGVDLQVQDHEERLHIIERRWLPVLTSIRAKLIFFPAAVLFILASLSHLWSLLQWCTVKAGGG